MFPKSAASSTASIRCSGNIGLQDQIKLKSVAHHGPILKTYISICTVEVLRDHSINNTT